MGFFTPKRKPHFTTGHAADDEVLGAIAEQGDLTRPRHWVHFIYFPNEPTARSWAESIEAAGWDIQAVGEAATGDGQWIVMPERHGAVLTEDAVRAARSYFESVAAQVAGARYDGWEASV